MKTFLRRLFQSIVLLFLVIGQPVTAAWSDGSADRPDRFSPADHSAVLAPGDENWDDRFGGPAGAHSPNGQVCAIAVDGTDIYVGGDFTTAGGKTANYVARWDSKTNEWFPLGSGLTPTPIDNCEVRTLQVAGKYLYVGGMFSAAGGVPGTARVTRWNILEQEWESLGGTIVGGWPTSMAYDGTNIYIAGITQVCQVVYVCPPSSVINTHYVAGYNSTEYWFAVGTGFHSPVWDLAVGSDGLFAAGSFKKMNGDVGDFIACWDGREWKEVGSGTDNSVASVAASGHNVFVAGTFQKAGGQPANHAARWDGSAWSALGSGLGGVYYGVENIAAIQDEVYFIGDFSTAGGVPANKIAHWDNKAGTWSALGSGLSSVYAWTVALGNNSVYAGGPFGVAGGKPSNYFAVWHTTLPLNEKYFLPLIFR